MILYRISIFCASLCLPPGKYQYKFIVDNNWRIDETLPKEINNFKEENILEIYPATAEIYESRDSVKISKENIICISEKGGVLLRICTNLVGKDVKVKGNWDNWSKEYKLEKTFFSAINSYKFVTYLQLYPGKYLFKFIINGIWMHDSKRFSVKDEFGGKNNLLFLKKREDFGKFNLEKLHWFQISMNELNFSAIQGHSMSLIGDYIFIFGGFFRNVFRDSLYIIKIDTLEIYSPETGGRIPEARAYHGSVVIGTALLIYGGINEKKIFTDLHILNCVNLKWSKVNCKGELPPALERFSFVNVGDEFLVIFGGYVCSNNLEFEKNYNDLYSINLENMTCNALLLKGDIPEARYSHSANVLNKYLYIYGGLQRTGNTSGKGPENRYAHSSVIIDKYLAVFGGRRSREEFLNDLYLFDTISEEWIQPKIEDPPQGRCFHGCVVVEGNNGLEMLVFGGQKAHSFLNVGVDSRSESFEKNENESNIISYV